MRILASVLSLGLACVPQALLATVADETADRILLNGSIVTVDDAHPTALAVALKNGKILAVGTRADVEKLRAERTVVTDLKGATLVPGFVDSHSHVGDYTQVWGKTDLAPPPVGEVTDLTGLKDRLKRAIEREAIPPGQTVAGYNYDDSMIAEKRHPDRRDLDEVSTEHPVVIIHISGHVGAANSLALGKLGITRGSPDPRGGVFRRDLETNEPTGVVEEQAVFLLLSLFPKKSIDDSLRDFLEIQRFYASQGITTAQDGQTLPPTLRLLRKLNDEGKLLIDVVAYPKWTTYNKAIRGEDDPALSESPALVGKVVPQFGTYDKRLKIGGIKITSDGSPQGKTAYLTKPYLKPPPGRPASYRGYPVVQQDELDRWFDAAYAQDFQILVHCAGDAAADAMIAAVRNAQAKHGKKDLRTTMVHAHVVRPDQLDTMKELGILPTFFTAHTFFWGDWHLNETLGADRAYFLSPARAALDRGMKFGNHTDAPVVPPDQIFTIHTAVNRTSRSGVIVGPDQRISPLEALKAVTLWGAYIYREENSKGSIEPGKRADLVILSANPLAVAPETIKDIKVLETIKDGGTIYKL